VHIHSQAMIESSYRPPPYEDESQHYASIPLYLVLTILTLFLFNLYWNYRQMVACNSLLRRREFGFLAWLILSLLTCGLYHFYYQYKMGAAILEIQQERQLQVSQNLPLISIMATLLGVGILADCIHQHEINKIVT
jgi:hypothetical protein